MLGWRFLSALEVCRGPLEGPGSGLGHGDLLSLEAAGTALEAGADSSGAGPVGCSCSGNEHIGDFGVLQGGFGIFLG